MLTIVCEIKEELSPIGPRCLYPEPVEGKSYCLLKRRDFRKGLRSPFEILSQGDSWSLELGKSLARPDIDALKSSIYT